MDVHVTLLDTSMQCRKNLTGVEETSYIKGAFEPFLLGKIGLGEHLTHEPFLLYADTVLAA